MAILQYSYTLNAWFWFGTIILFFALEYLLKTSGFLIILGVIAALLSLLLWNFPAVPWPYQLLFFSLTGIIASVSWWAYLLRHPLTFRHQEINNLKKQIFVLEQPIVNGQGILKINDKEWRIIGPDLPIGAKVRIMALENSILHVKRAS